VVGSNLNLISTILWNVFIQMFSPSSVYCFVTRSELFIYGKYIHTLISGLGLWCFNATFNNILVISWGSVLLVEETRAPRENHRPVASHGKLYHIMLYLVHFTWAGFELTTLVVIGANCIGRCKSNYHTIMMAPHTHFSESLFRQFIVVPCQCC
jgi:hypothetical protein